MHRTILLVFTQRGELILQGRRQVKLARSRQRLRVFKCVAATHLHKQRITKSQRTLQILPESVIQEAGTGDLTILVFVHDKLCSLT